jgi:hypothetical protein
MPIPLEQMVSTFGLNNVEEKPFFPHIYNKKVNLDVELPHLPPKSDYLYRSMKPKKKQAFEQWYNAAVNTPFCLRQELASYCSADVRLLNIFFVILLLS